MDHLVNTVSANGSDKPKGANRNSDILISVCAIVPDNIEQLEAYLRTTRTILEGALTYYELLLIDNGTPVATSEAIQQLQRVLPNVRALRLSRRYSHEVAIAAALDHCVGDYVVVMDSVVHPPELIPAMIERAMSGFDAVLAEPLGRKPGFLQRLIAQPVYRLASRITGFTMQPDESYFRVFSRRLVNSLIRIRSKNRSLSFMNGIVGLRRSVIFYQPPALSGKTRQGRLLQQLGVVTGIIVSNSAIPLRFAAFIGFLACVMNLLYLFYIFAVSVIKSRIAEGWLTTSLMNTVMFLLLFLIIAILAEYVARILDESKEQPLYFVESETNSSVSNTNLDRLNIV
jgi:glycosyltransferase involved in cell wall biosynthesis